MFRPLSAIILTCLLMLSSIGPLSSVYAITVYQPFPNGVDVWVVTTPHQGTMAIRLEIRSGLKAEHEGQPGQAAALLAMLLAGPTATDKTEQLHKKAVTAGISTHTTLGPDAVHLTFEGPDILLNHAMALAVERLKGIHMTASDANSISGYVWHGHRASQYRAVSVKGTPLDVISAHTLPQPMPTPFESRVRASQMRPTAFAQAAAKAYADCPIRLLVTAPEERVGGTRKVITSWLNHFVGRVTRKARSSAQKKTAAKGGKILRKRIFTLRHRRDQSHLLGFGWHLPGKPGATTTQRIPRYARLALIAYAWQQPGARLHRTLVSKTHQVDTIETRLMLLDSPVLLMRFDLNQHVNRQARKALIKTLKELGQQPPIRTELDGLKEAFLGAYALRYRHPSQRLADISRLITSQEISDKTSYGQWRQQFVAAIKAITAREWVDTWQNLFESQRGTIGYFRPEPRTSKPLVPLTADRLAKIENIMVALRCDVRQPGTKRLDFLTQRFGISSFEYLQLARSLSPHTRLGRNAMSRALERCAEYKRLRAAIPERKIPELYKALRCGRKKSMDASAHRRAVLKKYKLDPSMLRPLLNMTRRVPKTRALLDAINTLCPATEHE